MRHLASGTSKSASLICQGNDSAVNGRPELARKLVAAGTHRSMSGGFFAAFEGFRTNTAGVRVGRPATFAGRPALPEISQTEDEGIRGVRTIDVPHHQRAGLNDAVDDARIERVIEDVQRLVQVRERARDVPG